MKPICLRLVLCALTAGYALIYGTASQVWADNTMSDADKRAKIESMYRDYKKDFTDVADISPAEAMALWKAGQALFVDVRTAKEQAASMLPGAIAADEFLKDPERYRDRVIIGYCTISYRSGKLADTLRVQGITMLNLKGGLLAWVHAGGKVYDRNGETRRIHVYGRKWNLGPMDYEALW
jgi:sodium/bile acid cotransporter 7